MHWIYLIHEFHNLSWITEINELFHDILIYWDAPVYAVCLSKRESKKELFNRWPQTQRMKERYIERVKALLMKTIMEESKITTSYLGRVRWHLILYKYNMTMKVDCLVSNPANKDRLNTSKDQDFKSTASSKSTIQICTSFTVTTEKRKLALSQTLLSSISMWCVFTHSGLGSADHVLGVHWKDIQGRGEGGVTAASHR